MYCTKCGTELPTEAKFCMACGQPVVKPAEEKPQAKGDKQAQAETGSNAAAAGEATGETETEMESETSGEDNVSTSIDDSSETEAETGAADSTNPEEATAPEAEQDETQQPSEADKSSDESTDDSDVENADEAETASSADKTVLISREALSNAGTTTVISRKSADATTLLPGRGTEKAALEQEHSDQVEALAALYPDVDPGQFCDPTPIEAKSPDITEYMPPVPSAENGTPASAESLRYAVNSTKKRSRRRVPMVVLVALALALAAGMAYAAYRIYNDVWLPAQQEQPADSAEEAPAEEQPQNLSYTVENQTVNVSVPADPFYSPGVRTTAQWTYPQIKASGKSDAVDKINKAIQQSMQADVDATNAAPDTEDAMSGDVTFTCTSRSITVTYIDDEIVCVRDQRYDTGWGPHGDTTVTGCVYSLKTGETVDPGSMFGLDASQLKAAAGTAVSTYLASDPSDISTTNDVVQDVQSHCTDDPSETSGLNTLDGSSYFYIASEGLIFASSDYQMGSYAYGRREIVVVPRDGSTVKAGSTVALDAPMGYQG